MADKIKVLGISGSLRNGSFNTAALRAAQELAPEGMVIETVDIGNFPLYNEDVRAKGYPIHVEEFRQRLREADGVLIVTPEYNYSTSGVLKNAIDWASRPPSQPFDEKIIAIMGASPSMLGTGRAQYHLRQMFVYLNSHVLNRPEVMIAQADKKFDEKGVLTDETTKKFISSLLVELKNQIDQSREKNMRTAKAS